VLAGSVIPGGCWACPPRLPARPRVVTGRRVGATHPDVAPSHPLGCDRRRVPDRMGFDHVVAALVHGAGDDRIASPGGSARTLRRRVRAWTDAGWPGGDRSPLAAPCIWSGATTAPSPASCWRTSRAPRRLPIRDPRRRSREGRGGASHVPNPGGTGTGRGAGVPSERVEASTSPCVAASFVVTRGLIQRARWLPLAQAPHPETHMMPIAGRSKQPAIIQSRGILDRGGLDI
jgi:hypothetical protein